MSPKSAKRLKARQEYVAGCLRSCASRVDPRYALLKSLAEKIEYHPLTLSGWIAQGRVPHKAALTLKHHFDDLIDVAHISQG